MATCRYALSLWLAAAVLVHPNVRIVLLEGTSTAVRLRLMLQARRLRPSLSVRAGVCVCRRASLMRAQRSESVQLLEIKNITRRWYIGTRLPIPDLAAIDGESELFAP